MVSNINDTSTVEAPVETFTSTEFGSIRALSDEQGEWRNDALDRMLDTKGSETDDQRD